MVRVVDRTNSEWWFGVCKGTLRIDRSNCSGKRGFFPAQYVEFLPETTCEFKDLGLVSLLQTRTMILFTRTHPRYPFGSFHACSFASGRTFDQCLIVIQTRTRRAVPRPVSTASTGSTGTHYANAAVFQTGAGQPTADAPHLLSHDQLRSKAPPAPPATDIGTSAAAGSHVNGALPSIAEDIIPVAPPRARGHVSLSATRCRISRGLEKLSMLPSPCICSNLCRAHAAQRQTSRLHPPNGSQPNSPQLPRSSRL